MNIFEEAENNFAYAVQHRRYLHAHPEMTGKELNTVAYICKELERLEIPYVEVPDGGVIGRIDGERPGKTVLLRADIDALPITENPQNLTGAKQCVSQVPGLCHACGHDAHTAMLLTEAKILNAHKETLNGHVILCFERGEEGGGQFKNLLYYIVRDAKLPIDSCMATHVRWDLDTGYISAEPGPVFAGVYGYVIKLHGLTGHGSRPDLAHSVLDCFHAIYDHMQMIRMKYVKPSDILTFSIGTVQCGTLKNIIPDELTFAGTIRTYNVEGAGGPFVRQFLKVLQYECELNQCTYEIVYMPDPVFESCNNETCSEITKNAVRTYIGPEAIHKVEPWMASETMNAYLKLWPGVITFTGIRNAAVGSGANHHTPEFDIDERGMIYGVAAGVGYTVDFLNYQGEIPFQPFTGTLKNLLERFL